MQDAYRKNSSFFQGSKNKVISGFRCGHASFNRKAKKPRKEKTRKNKELEDVKDVKDVKGCERCERCARCGDV